MKKVIGFYLFAVMFTALAAPATWAESEAVTIGYQLIFNPWKVAIAGGDFEKATGYKINWCKFDSPGKLLPAITSGDVQIGLMGSTGVATAMSKNLNVELFWIAESIAAAEALVLRDGSGIVAPQDLIGKKLATPFVSTTHFHILFALEQFGIDPKKVTLLNLPPNAIAAASQRGDIDAAFVWDPALSTIKKTGKVLITSGERGRWGKPTFDGLVVEREFARRHPEFMLQFVQVLAQTDASYRDNPEAWTPESPQVQAIVSLVGGEPKEVPAVLAGYIFPTPAQQVSCDWLGCGKTTLLNLLAGFIPPSAGLILLDGREVLRPHKDRGVVFQKHALSPWLNVLENAEFGLRLQGVPRNERRKAALRFLSLVGLDEFRHYPVYKLSGGMQQRLGIARVLTSDPHILLMDEPFGALDALTRDTMQELILNVWADTRKMIFFITHSVEEALFLATRLVVMSPRPGRIVHSFDLDFSRQYLQGRKSRTIKSQPDYIDMREKVFAIVRKQDQPLQASI